MRRSRFDYTRYGIEPPFPWLGIAIGAALGLALLPALTWLGFELIDRDLKGFTR